MISSDRVKLTEKSKALCADYYDFSDKKKAGCGKCPIQSECYGETFRTFRTDTKEGIDAWTNAINQAADKVNRQRELSI